MQDDGRMPFWGDIRNWPANATSSPDLLQTIWWWLFGMGEFSWCRDLLEGWVGCLWHVQDRSESSRRPLYINPSVLWLESSTHYPSVIASDLRLLSPAYLAIHLWLQTANCDCELRTVTCALWLAPWPSLWLYILAPSEVHRAVTSYILFLFSFLGIELCPSSPSPHWRVATSLCDMQLAMIRLTFPRWPIQHLSRSLPWSSILARPFTPQPLAVRFRPCRRFRCITVQWYMPPASCSDSLPLRVFLHSAVPPQWHHLHLWCLTEKQFHQASIPWGYDVHNTGTRPLWQWINIINFILVSHTIMKGNIHWGIS